MSKDNDAAAPVIRLRTAEEVARAQEQLEALKHAAPASVEALIRAGLENALEALRTVSGQAQDETRPGGAQAVFSLEIDNKLGV
jgi:hypothetical protein